MLILTRKVGQSFCIGDDIRITITEISGDKVKMAKIGIEAPKSLRVLRDELSQTISSNQQAMTEKPASQNILRELAANLHGLSEGIGKGAGENLAAKVNHINSGED